jgi:hypothetical protein
MHDAGKPAAGEQLFGRGPVGEVEAMKGEVRMRAELTQSRLFNR